jgi:hypothetical protein
VCFLNETLKAFLMFLYIVLGCLSKVDFLDWFAEERGVWFLLKLKGLCLVLTLKAQVKPFI